VKLQVVKGDITAIEADAIVNAANSSLLGGGGVDGAIHRKGGPAILAACRVIGGCETGDAVITTAGKLPARHVIHTVGPIWHGGDNGEPGQLARCYRSSLELCVEHDLATVAFPNISTGVYRFPKRLAAELAIDAVANFDHQGVLSAVYFVCFDDENYEIYDQLI
jgi:O-acetyl-ADP-ribose deacetylase (regulator of RNase III)